MVRIVPQGPLSSPRAHGALGRISLGGYPAAYASGLTDNALSSSVELFSTLPGQGPLMVRPATMAVHPAVTLGVFVGTKTLWYRGRILRC